MNFKEVVKDSFVVVGYSAAGKWNNDIVYPIPELWQKASQFINNRNATEIIGVCLPPRSDHYFYTCGFETTEVKFENINKGMTLHTFPKQKYVVFKHVGPASKIPNTYAELWKTFDEQKYTIEKGLPEIEIVKSSMFGKENKVEYEMEIWIPVN